VPNHDVQIEQRGPQFWVTCSNPECGEPINGGRYLVGRYLIRAAADEQAREHEGRR
jgi:hypothetical protein